MAQPIKVLKSREVEFEEILETLEHSLSSEASINPDEFFHVIDKMNLSLKDKQRIISTIKEHIAGYTSRKAHKRVGSYTRLINMLEGKSHRSGEVTQEIRKSVSKTALSTSGNDFSAPSAKNADPTSGGLSSNKETVQDIIARLGINVGPRIKSILMEPDKFDEYGVHEGQKYQVLFHSDNSELIGTDQYRGPSYGVDISLPDGKTVIHVIEDRKAKVGELVMIDKYLPKEVREAYEYFKRLVLSGKASIQKSDLISLKRRLSEIPKEMKIGSKAYDFTNIRSRMMNLAHRNAELKTVELAIEFEKFHLMLFGNK